MANTTKLNLRAGTNSNNADESQMEKYLRNGPYSSLADASICQIIGIA
jgi:hypothetical protein